MGLFQRKTEHSGLNTEDSGAVPPIVHEVLRSPGQPLNGATRAFMEPRFGHDFSLVRIHTDARAAESASAVNALAYTVGSHIAFSTGLYDPGNPRGLGLLAHELTHVIQQEGQPGSEPEIRTPNSEIAEQEARGAADALFLSDSNEPAVPSFNSQPRAIARGEKWDAIWGVGPWDAYKAKQLADKALKEAQNTGLPGIHNGAADAWRHCYWNCTMAAEIGADQAKTIADNHEKHGGGPVNENTMDYHNNAEGRSCGGKSCDKCCQDSLDASKLRVLDGKGGVVPSSPTSRATKPSISSGEYKY
jgi:hypothetical protein